MKEFSHSSDLPFPERRKSRLSKGVALFPSMLTAAAMFAGFYSIIYTLNEVLEGRNDFRPAVYAILTATLLDSLDGRMARLMKVESDFGSHFDSIADMVSFGVAPAVFAYCVGLSKLGRLGWLGAFLYLACAAIRLARFNVLAAEGQSKKYFKGMSSPVAAAGLCVFAILLRDFDTGLLYQIGLLLMTGLVAFLMISNVRFRSFKDLDFRNYPLQYFLGVMAIVMLIVIYHEIALFGLFVIYLLSGLIEEYILFRRRRKSDPSVPFLPFGDREDRSG
ncbi:MAG: CDP-diacylglycerol--serine O-phosphatidyltransferase [Bacteriovoracaceae bacterium]|nr:CDP-diacylglycerol--serine O-phosphatidyltransferase [Bacteriovoracaceae bacterium]